MGQEGSLQSQAQMGQHTLDSIAALIKGGNAKKIVVMTGAGISTSAGIPDFRSPRTGLYANLKRLNLPYPEAVFDISYFREQPEPFYVLAREIYPGKYLPTISHVFISLLARRGLLLKLFTQNIDCLERAAGVPPELIIEAHGSFATQRCIECKTAYPDDLMKEHVEKGSVPRCAVEGSTCSGLVKPDIVFFGEGLPPSFSTCADVVPEADLVIILGTSLTVYPFAALPEMANRGAPRLLLNWERVGNLGSRPYDVVELGPCDYGVRKLAEELGWTEELDKLWRETVGEEEAEKQIMRQAMHGDDLKERDDEIIEAIAKNVADLHLEGGDEGEGAKDVSSNGPGEGPEVSGETRDEGVDEEAQGSIGQGEAGVAQSPKAKELNTSQERMNHLAAHIHQGPHAGEDKSEDSVPAETSGLSEPTEGKGAEAKSAEPAEAILADTSTEKSSGDKTPDVAPAEAPKLKEETATPVK